MCSTNEPFGYCRKGVGLGCNYQNQSGNPEYCCISNCYACEKVKCPQPDNDCYESSKCMDGVCLPFVMRPDGSVCHSKSWGVCSKGQCLFPREALDVPTEEVPISEISSTSDEQINSTDTQIPTSDIPSNQTETEKNLNRIDTQLAPWKIGLIVASSVLGVALIVLGLVITLVPSIRTKVFVKTKIVEE
jgi:hypothetical protein